MKTEVCTWRVTPDLKAEIEREARYRKQPVSALIETAVREHLKQRRATESEEEKQRRLHAAVDECIGTLDLGPDFASTAEERAGEVIYRKYLRKRRVR